jgi:integrating conjugative element relaxase (TIGR03760 family)
MLATALALAAILAGVALCLVAWFFGREASSVPIKASDSSATTPLSHWLPVLSADQLAHRLNLDSTLLELRRATQAEASNYEGHYRPLIERYLRFVQMLPASEAHHHAHPGGLAQHTLEVAVLALTARQQLMLPKGARPEDTARLRHRWTFAVLAGALLHDVGKPVSDVRIQYYTSVDSEEKTWSPLAQDLEECGARFYTVDFASQDTRDYSAHKRLGMSLFMQFAPKEAIAWLSEDRDLMSQLTSYLNGETDDGVIADLVKAADAQSTRRNLLSGPRTRFATARAVPLIERMMEALRRMLAEGGTLPLNRNGAAGWVYQGEIYFVARRLAEEVRTYLQQNESAEGLPGDKMNDRLFDVWQDYGAIVVNPATDGAVWHVSIEGLSGEMFLLERMSVLRFPLGILLSDPAKYPQSFVGRVTVLDSTTSPATSLVSSNVVTGPASVSTGAFVSHANIETEHIDDFESVRPSAAPRPQTQPMQLLDPSQLPKALQDASAREEFLDNDDTAASIAASKPGSRVVATDIEAMIENDYRDDGFAAVDALPEAAVDAHHPAPPPLRAQPLPKNAKAPSELAIEILHWMRNGLESGDLMHNVKDGVIHFVEDGLLLVSPRFFRLFAEGKVGAGDTKAIAELEKKAQQALVKAGWTLKASNGQNIVGYAVANSMKVLNGMVIAKAFAAKHIVEMPYTNELLKRIEPEKKEVTKKVIPRMAAATRSPVGP